MDPRRMSDLPAERKFYEFEQGTVIYNVEHVPDKEGAVPKLEVQVLDQYGYQRELSLRFRDRQSEKAFTYYWELHTYRHPGRRDIQHVSERLALIFIARFLEICEKYPILLFNPADSAKGEPRHKGFVQLSERLLDGERYGEHMLK